MIKLSSIKAVYIPLLIVYFTTGLAGISAVTSTVFFKDTITLDAAVLISLGVYISLPWSIKMVFGSLIDSVRLFGNNRKSYIYLGQLLVFLGTVGMVDHVSTKFLISSLGEFTALLLSGLTATIGVVISDVVADVMAIELVPEDDPDRDKNLGIVQVLSRLSLMFGGLLAAFVTGPLASTFSAATVYSLELLCPAIAVVATFLSPTQAAVEPSPVNRSLLLGGVGYGALTAVLGYFFDTDIVFLVSLSILSVMMFSLIRESFPVDKIKPFVYAMLAIFLFRTVPGIGPAGSWWYMNELGFDADFMGVLRIVGSVAGFITLMFLADLITKHSIFRTMLVLTGLITILSLPDILIFYNLTFGLSPRTLVLVDAAMIAPLAQLSMIPLGVLIARNAPPASRAAYISLTASLMNISLVGGDVITKKLNEVFLVTRDDFTNLGELMIYSLLISTIFSIIGLVLLKIGGRDGHGQNN